MQFLKKTENMHIITTRTWRRIQSSHVTKN